MPDCKAGLMFQGDYRRESARLTPAPNSFRDVLLHMLMEKGGDFQNARFSGDTVLRIERRAVEALGKYRIHVKELPIGELVDCADLVDVEADSCDFGEG